MKKLILLALISCSLLPMAEKKKPSTISCKKIACCCIGTCCLCYCSVLGGLLVAKNLQQQKISTSFSQPQGPFDIRRWDPEYQTVVYQNGERMRTWDSRVNGYVDEYVHDEQTERLNTIADIMRDSSTKKSAKDKKND